MKTMILPVDNDDWVAWLGASETLAGFNDDVPMVGSFSENTADIIASSPNTPLLHNSKAWLMNPPDTSPPQPPHDELQWCECGVIMGVRDGRPNCVECTTISTHGTLCSI